MTNCYYLFSPRGFANEGTVFIVPQEHTEIAEKRLAAHVEDVDDNNAKWWKVTHKNAIAEIGREGTSRVSHVSWAFPEGATADDMGGLIPGVLAASSWLWE